MKAKRDEWQRTERKTPSNKALTIRSLRQRHAPDDSTSEAILEDTLTVKLLWDSGAARVVLTSGAIAALEAQGVKVLTQTLTTPKTLLDFQKRPLVFKTSCTLKQVRLQTGAGPLLLRNVQCYVQDLETIEFTMSMGVMHALGHSTKAFLHQGFSTPSSHAEPGIRPCAYPS